MSAATEAEARHARGRRRREHATPPRRWTCCSPTPRRSPLRRFLPGMSGVRFTANLARRPRRVGRADARAGRRAGQDRRRPLRARGAREGPPLRRGGLGQEPAASSAPCRPTWRRRGRLRGLVDDAELGWGDEQRMGFIVDNLVEASAPSNNPFLNPKVLKRIIDTGGGNLVEGGRRFVRDFATAPRVPSMVEPDAFEVGTDIAVTPGAVVLRTDVFELIQYTPQTAKVREMPLLIVPPTINKYYVIDLAEQRSLVEHLVRRRPAGLLHLLAQPRRPARRLGPGHLRPGDHRGDGRHPEDRAAGQGRDARHLLRRDARLDGAGAPRRRSATSTGSRRSAWRSPCSTRSRPGCPARCCRTRRRPRRPGRRRRRATSTAGCSPRCSPGCGPTT